MLNRIYKIEISYGGGSHSILNIKAVNLLAAIEFVKNDISDKAVGIVVNDLGILRE